MAHCNKCGGSGRIPNPKYPDRARILDNRFEGGYLPYPSYERELIRIFGSMDNIPEEEVPCPVCTGSKRLRSTSERVYNGA
jgi:hypothetical protein